MKYHQNHFDAEADAKAEATNAEMTGFKQISHEAYRAGGDAYTYEATYSATTEKEGKSTTKRFERYVTTESNEEKRWFTTKDAAEADAKRAADKEARGRYQLDEFTLGGQDDNKFIWDAEYSDTDGSGVGQDFVRFVK